MKKAVILGLFFLMLNVAVYCQQSSQAESANPSSAEVENYKQKLMSNPETAAVVTSLATDPQIQALANDPEVAAAAKANDLEALMKNEKFMSIVNSPKMQEEVKKIKQ